jgi:plastocyanin
MTLVSIKQREMVGQYFHDKLGLHPSNDFRGVCHVVPPAAGEPVSMDDVAVAVGYDNFIGRVCCMHTVIAKPEHMARRIVNEAFEFPFLVCGCEAVIALVDSTNEAALEFDRRLGFHEIACIPHAGLEGDLVVLCMRRENCRWLRPQVLH